MKKKCLCLGALVLALLSGCTAVSAETVGQTDAGTEPRTAVRYMDTLPGNWNIESARTPEKEYLRQMTSTALYAVEDGELIPGLAQLPVDITGDYAGDARYGIPAGAERGYAFRITLREDVFWQDGAAVTAEDVLFSIRTLLESKSLAQDYLWIANAEGYLGGWERPAETVVSLKDAGFATVAEAQAGGYRDFYLDVGNFWGLDAGWVSVADRSRILDRAMTPGIDEMYVTPAYLYAAYLAEGTALSYLQSGFLGVTGNRADTLSQEDVGILKTGDYELVIISREPVTAGTVAARLLPVFLLRQELYGEHYGSSPEYYSSCGPYRITVAGADEIRLERNEYWQGESFPADVIRCVSR